MRASIRLTAPLLATLAGAALSLALLAVWSTRTSRGDAGFPYADPSLPVEQRVDDLLGRMTLEEKIGQMTQVDRTAVVDRPSDIAAYHLGSILSGGGSVPTPNRPAAWAKMVDGFQAQALQTRLEIPLLYGIDAVHGDNNLYGATVFPHDIGLGATRDPALVREVGAITAQETRATGITWDFAPCLCVSRDERWGRTYESFGEDPALVSSMTTIIDGLQGTDAGGLAQPDHVLATAKHFVGDGGTAFGSSTTAGYTIDQGVTRTTMPALMRLFVAPYEAAVARHVGAVMVSFSSVAIAGEGGPLKMHADQALLTGLLKQKLGFDGFVVSDWGGIDQISPDYRQAVVTAIDAGIDMVMVPKDYVRFETTLKAAVDSGQVPQARIDDAVRRILRAKFELGLFEHSYSDRRNIRLIGSAAHRAVARRAAAESQVLLKNEGRLLPLPRRGRLYVAGSNANDLGNQMGGWTITWQGASGRTDVGTTILQGIRRDAPRARITFSEDASAPLRGYDAGIVVVGEMPYAEGVGDVGNGHSLSLSAADQRAIDRVCKAMKCAVLVVSGRPLIVTGRLKEIDALVASWLPGSEGEGVADTLFGLQPFTGRLPVTWPRSVAQLPIDVGDRPYDPLFRYGVGLR
jgi:beta-glucosidase